MVGSLPSPYSPHHERGERHGEPARQRRWLLAAQRHATQILVPADDPHLQAFEGHAELASEQPPGPLHQEEPQGAVHGQVPPREAGVVALPEPGEHLYRRRDRLHRSSGQGRDRPRLEPPERAAGEGPFDILGDPEVPFHAAGELGHGPHLVGLQRALRGLPADHLGTPNGPLVGRGPPGDEPLAQAAHRAHHALGCVAADGVGGEGHPGRIGRDQPLHEHGHHACSGWGQGRAVGAHPRGERRGPAAAHRIAQRFGPAHVEDRLVQAREGRAGGVLADRRGTHRERASVERSGGAAQSLFDVGWQRRRLDHVARGVRSELAGRQEASKGGRGQDETLWHREACVRQFPEVGGLGPDAPAVGACQAAQRGEVRGRRLIRPDRPFDRRARASLLRTSAEVQHDHRGEDPEEAQELGHEEQLDPPRLRGHALGQRALRAWARAGERKLELAEVARGGDEH